MDKPLSIIEINHVYNGDCFELFSLLDDDSVDHVFTSPPYNRRRNDKYAFYNDTIADYYGFLLKIVEEARRVARKYVFINLQINYYNASDVYALIGTYRDKIKQMIIWEKSNPLPANGNNVTNAYEIFLVIGESQLRSNTTYTKNVIHTSVYSKMPKEHKAVMHPDVADWFVKQFTQQGEVILDPFIGIGTTGVACVRNNRNFIGFEIVKEYSDMANRNIENAKTGHNGGDANE